jgi:hypothetical protein
MMDEEEVNAFRSYVESGGGLYASKYTSLTSKDGVRMDNFMLSDVFGVSYVDETNEDVTYISPTLDGDIFVGYTHKYPLSIYGTQIKVNAKNQTKILGKLALPYTDPKDPTRYVSIHGNPPGVVTEYPAVVFNEYYKGRAVYVSGEMENNEVHSNVFISLIKLLVAGSLTFESDAPKSVEITAFNQEDKNRYIINLLNLQEKLPNIPVDGIKVKMWLGDKKIKRLIRLPEEGNVNYEVNNEFIEFIAPRVETFLMLALEYE